MKLRTPGTLSSAINKIKTKLSEGKCAVLVERSESLIRKWADPDDPALPNLRQSLMLDSAYVQEGFGRPPIQDWYMDRLEFIIKKEPKKAVNIVMSTLQAQSGIGEIALLVARFTQRGSLYKSDLSRNERIALMGLIKKLSVEIDHLQNALEEAKDYPKSTSLENIWVK